ncbi:hypothetical protein FGIG_02266 [Fasciola gigantica]|uniref:Uncharacterized protein n=1 Tax=Fasciola gigantica TaxID=46835 RepID=A0A504YXY1_FASGI|nr:hypothetical protein FGIG_02266 [Fasciola gigantica]
MLNSSPAQSTGKPSTATTILASLTTTTDPTAKPNIEQAAENTDIPKRAITKSPSFGQHVNKFVVSLFLFTGKT